MAEYYIAVNGESLGPFTLEELQSRGDLYKETLVWKPGMTEWKPLAEFEELLHLAESPKLEPEVEERLWFAMIGGERQVGPRSISELFKEGLDKDTPVWTGGMDNWKPAVMIPEFEKYFQVPPVDRGSQISSEENPSFGPGINQSDNPFANNPQYNPNHSYHKGPRHNQYQQQYGHQYHNSYNQYYSNEPRKNYGPMRTNWLPWAIGATVVGFFLSCIGAIFGIIGIVQANKANTLYSMEDYGAANQANNSAKIMTIIGYIFAGLGFLAFLFFSGVTASISSISNF